MAKLADLIHTMETLAPPFFAEEWDNVGLQQGHPDQDLAKVLLALTPSEDVVDEAIAGGYDLLLTHHPLIFSGLKTLRQDHPQGRILAKMIKADLAHYCAHTNLDVAPGGVNDVLAGRLGLQDTKVLAPAGSRKTYKLTVFVPLKDVQAVQAALFQAGAGQQGAYDACSWQCEGLGSYRPLEGAQPAIGQVGHYHEEAEARLEVLVQEKDLARVQHALLQAHPYEEVAYDLFEEVHQQTPYGLGRIGQVPQPQALRDLLPRWSQALETDLKVFGSQDRVVDRVGLCGGSGQSLLNQAVRAGCQVYLTGDVRYHGFQEAQEKGIVLIDAGHYASEAPVLDHVAQRLQEAHPDLCCQLSRVEADFSWTYPYGDV